MRVKLRFFNRRGWFIPFFCTCIRMYEKGLVFCLICTPGLITSVNPYFFFFYIFDFLSRTTWPKQFQWNLSQSIIEWREFKFVQLKGYVLFQREIIKIYWTCVSIFQIFFSQKPFDQKIRFVWKHWRMRITSFKPCHFSELQSLFF